MYIQTPTGEGNGSTATAATKERGGGAARRRAAVPMEEVVAANTPVRGSDGRVGRNDPCPCGIGGKILWEVRLGNRDQSMGNRRNPDP